MNKNILIVNFNTTFLTQCCIKSVNKHTPGCKIYVFDNSDKEPFINIFNNVTVFDNTKGEIIDFEKWLSLYPKRNSSMGKSNNYASAKHCYTVERGMELIGENFLLLDSDVLLKKDISELFDERYVYVGDNELWRSIRRVIPYICFINVKMCKEKGIHYYDEHYMHGLYVTVEGDRYDTGANFYISAKNFPHKDIKCSDYIEHLHGASWRTSVYNTAEAWLEKNKELWEEERNKKVVYTCITGGYDILKPLSYVNEDFDYICFTDCDMKSDFWEIRRIPEELNSLDNIRKQRCIKINPHKYLPEYEFSVWVDGNIDIKADINEYLKENGVNNNISLYVGEHPKRNCIYKEALACIRLKKDSKEVINKQIEGYKKEKFPYSYGLPQTCIIFRYHNDKQCIKLMETWWEEVKAKSYRDQLSFNYALWKNSDVKIKYLNKEIFNCKYFKWNSGHKKMEVKEIVPKIKEFISEKLDVVKEEVETFNDAELKRKIKIRNKYIKQSREHYKFNNLNSY